MRHPPVITLLSDLGSAGASVSVAKATLARHVPQAKLIDISHRVVPYDLQQAAYLLLSSYRHYPEETVHLIMTDVFSGGAIRIVLGSKDGHYFLSPDNGLLHLAFGKTIEPLRLCAEVNRPCHFAGWVDHAAGAIEKLEKHRADQFPLFETSQALIWMQPQQTPGGLDCSILHIDRYENVILNITRRQFSDTIGQAPFKIMLRARDLSHMHINYYDVPEGEPLCRFNEAGFLEIAVNRGSAASVLGLAHDAANSLRYRKIRIFF